MNGDPALPPTAETVVWMTADGIPDRLLLARADARGDLLVRADIVVCAGRAGLAQAWLRAGVLLSQLPGVTVVAVAVDPGTCLVRARGGRWLVATGPDGRPDDGFALARRWALLSYGSWCSAGFAGLSVTPPSRATSQAWMRWARGLPERS